MVEPAHRLQRHRVDQPRRSCRDFEHPAMIERESVAIALSRAGRRFLAGQPAAPWGNAPRTIADRARQRAEFALHFERARIEDQIGRAAWDDRSVVCAIAMGEWAARIITRDEFMVADKDDLIAAKRQAAHAIRLVGYRPAIGHGIAQARQQPVGKPAGQVEHSRRIGYQRAVICKSGGRRHRRAGPARAPVQQQSAEGRAGRAHESSTIDLHFASPRKPRATRWAGAKPVPGPICWISDSSVASVLRPAHCRPQAARPSPRSSDQNSPATPTRAAVFLPPL